MTDTDPRAIAADRACCAHYLTAISDSVAICASDAVPYRASEAAAYVAVLDYLIGDQRWYQHPDRALLPEVAWAVVSYVLPDSGPEPIDHMLRYAWDHVTEQHEIAARRAAWERGE